MDAFRKTATHYADRLRQASPLNSPLYRLWITIIGQGGATHDGPLFHKLHPYGAYFGRIKIENGLKLLLDITAERTKRHPLPYGHWYIDGGQEEDHDASLICVSYHALGPVRAALLRKMQAEIQQPGMGPETLRSFLAQMRAPPISVSATPETRC